MQCQHVDPDEAWLIHNDVCAFNSVGVHWGTFKLSDEVCMSLCVGVVTSQAIVIVVVLVMVCCCCSSTWSLVIVSNNYKMPS